MAERVRRVEVLVEKVIGIVIFPFSLLAPIKLQKLRGRNVAGKRGAEARARARKAGPSAAAAACRHHRYHHQQPLTTATA